MSCSGSDFLEFADRVHRAESIDVAFAAFEKQATKLGFEGVLYTFIPDLLISVGFPRPPYYRVSENYSQEYLSHYKDARFDKDDPIVKAISNGQCTPLDWWVEVDKGEMNDAGRRVIETAREDYKIG